MLYLCFFAVLCIFYGMPIHIIRDVALTIRSFYKRITDFMRYRHATRDMNERYPDATVEDIGNEDICIVCREGMRSWQPTQNVPNGGNDPVDERQRPKKLPCGHVLHFACLRSWLERQQLCPTCRQPVLATTPPTSAGVAPNANQQAGQRAQPDPAPGPAQGQGNQPQGEAGQRIRYFNLGPIRLGFGAGPLPRGFDPLNRNQPRAGGAPHDAARAGLAQQMGFPFNLGRPQNTNNSGPLAGQSAAGGVQDQLRAIEQTLMQEINGLQLQVHQLGLVSALQAELARLRAQQADPNSAAPLPTSSTTSIIPQIPSIHAYTQNGSQPGLRQGDSGFPPGMTIPDGWTLLPLQRSQPTMPAPSTSNPNPFSSTGPPQAPPSINTPNVHRSTPAEGSQSQPPSSLSTTIPSLAPGLSHEARENNRILPRQRDPRTAPSASEIPQWSSDWHGQNRERATESARTTQADPRVEAGSSSTRQRLDKGKGVAATVEDADNEASDTDTDSEL